MCARVGASQKLLTAQENIIIPYHLDCPATTSPSSENLFDVNKVQNCLFQMSFTARGRKQKGKLYIPGNTCMQILSQRVF